MTDEDGHLRPALVITAQQISDMFNQLQQLGRTDVAVRCGHCAETLPSPTAFAGHLLACECSNPNHNHQADT